MGPEGPYIQPVSAKTFTPPSLSTYLSHRQITASKLSLINP